MKPLADCRLYAFVDTAYLHGRSPVELAKALCDGGADLIQYRAKGQTAEAVLRTAEHLLPVVEAAGVGLVINDHWEVACRLGAPVCHLGQEDFFDAGLGHKRELPPRIGAPAKEPARAGNAIRPAGLETGAPLLGLSSHAPEQAQRAVAAGADYIAIGPVFPTGTKPGRPAVTLDYVRWAAANVNIPWFAIGGITLDNLNSVLAAGANRICVVSAILNQPDVTKACAEFRQRLPT
jgi:thiamine-phosphate pyrophosphorylase